MDSQIRNPHVAVLADALRRCILGETLPQEGSEAHARICHAADVLANKTPTDAAKVADFTALGIACLELLPLRMFPRERKPANVLQKIPN